MKKHTRLDEVLFTSDVYDALWGLGSGTLNAWLRRP